jgi:hypothetical protein
MIPMNYPQVAHVEVVPTQPQAADSRTIDHIRMSENILLDNVTYIVKINLSSPLPVTSAGFNLYVGNYRVSRYFEFPGGIYFKVFNPQFLVEHGGEPIRFSVGEAAAQDTGSRLPEQQVEPALDLDAAERRSAPAPLPTQEQLFRPGS